MRVMLVIGARPQIIKSAPVVHEASKDSDVEFQIVHTGQHYDFEMSKIFFNELDLSSPTTNLGVGSGSHAWQTGKMMIELEKTISKSDPDVVLVPGDTNSTLAGALASIKLHVPVAHIEAGARSYNMRMPEEINRRLTDHCSEVLFAVSENCVQNLLKEGIPEDQIHLVGDTMYDALLKHTSGVSGRRVLESLGLSANEYVVLTVHRPENVDDVESLKRVIKAVIELEELTIVFPVHPRTLKRLKEGDLLKRLKKTKHVKLVDPVGYHGMLQLVKNARMVFTDSGGLQKEAFWLRTFCVTLRERTEWVETVELGANVLVGSDRDRIVGKARECLAINSLESMLKALKNPFGGGDASVKIIEVLKEVC
ncbi:MAG: UDP-N-acetylglucosamine 2-epimerase (non-hydrolyzing) [Candidatus Bathyarchaeota archaeon]|nr:MAG: UDP-N-acetylglucosamine 2-epimerase (non-hydrolyzing) [Candidatus Bathyarchaeota archaeon]